MGLAVAAIDKQESPYEGKVKGELRNAMINKIVSPPFRREEKRKRKSSNSAFGFATSRWKWSNETDKITAQMLTSGKTP